MRWVHIGVVAGLLAAGLVLGRQVSAQTEQDLRNELVSRATGSGFSSPQTDAILDRLDRIAAADLPVLPVLDRYLEGLAKGVPLDRIEAAVDLLEARLLEAGRRVDSVFPWDRLARDRSARLVLIDHGAYALAAGVSPEGLEQAMRLASQEHSGPEEGAAPVLATGCLAAGGLNTDESLEVVRTAWSHGFRGSELEELGRDLAALAHDGAAPPRAVIEQVLERIRSGAERERIFQELDVLRGAGPEGPGYGPPGARPGEDPSHMHGAGGTRGRPPRGGGR